MGQPNQLYFNHLTQADGLSQTNNNVVFKDSRGFVWISSLNGLNRYDGQQIKVYKYNSDDPYALPDNYIQSRIYEDDIGNLWFSTYEALICYVRLHDNFEVYQVPTENGYVPKGYNLAFKEKGRVGVIVEGKSFYLFNTDDKSWSPRTKLDHKANRAMPIYDESESLSSLISWSYDSPGFYHVMLNHPNEIKPLQQFAGKNKEPSLYFTDGIMLSDTLLLSARKGFLVLPLNDEDWQFYKTPEWTPNHMSMYGANQLSVSLNRGGWLFMDRGNIPNGKQFKADPDNIYSISSNTTYGAWVDADGGLWTGATGIGVDFTQPQKVKFNNLDIGKLFGISGQPVGIHSIQEGSDGNIWCSSRGKGLFVISSDLKPVKHFTKINNSKTGLASNDVPYMFFDSQGILWAITYTGLSALPPKSKNFKKVDSQGFLYGLELDDGKLIFSKFHGGIHLLEELKTTAQLSVIPNIDSIAAYTHLYQNRKGWLFANKNISSISIFDVHNEFKLLFDLPIKGDVHCYYEETNSDTLWIGTKNGLVCLNQSSMEWKVYTELDGLPDEQIYSILNEGRHLWLTTNMGIVRYSKEQEHFHSFDQFDGLQGLEYNTNAFLKKANGEFWFGGIKGINYFFPDRVKFLNILPKIQITELNINDIKRDNLVCTETGATNISEIKSLQFDHQENTISFRFAALEYSNPSKNMFQYKLEGIDKEWVKSGTTGFARYPKLPPGKYEFKVKGSNSDGLWSSPKTVSINILKPWWVQWWFLSLGILLVSGIAYSIYKYRLAQLLRIELLRNQISTDLHDDIGATLSNLNILTTLIRQKLPEDSEALPLLARIEEEVQSSAESLDDIIWSINPKNDPLESVLARMRRFAGEIFEAREINGSVHFPQAIKNLRLEMGKRRHFYLLFKEAINNLAKYADCKEAEIVVSYLQGQLEMVVKDNGIGFDTKANATSGNGLSTMRERATYLKGKLYITSSPGVGTTIRLVFPITENPDR